MQHDEELISINVWLAGRSYRIRIKPEEEAATRKAVKEAEDKIVHMRNQYAGKDDQDFIAMCLLMYATDSKTEEEEEVSTPFFVKKELDFMIQRIDEALSK